MVEQLRVFVSHSHQDNDFCRQIVQSLRDAGADAWYDEHNLGWGELHEEIQRELGRRPIFVVILSKAAFESKWVKRETIWAYKLYDRDPSRAIVPVTAGQIDPADFDPEKGWLFLDDFKRIEMPGYKPFPVEEAARRLVRGLSLTPPGEAPIPITPQVTEDLADLLTRGKALAAQRQYAQALTLFERATDFAPGSFEAWFDRAAVLDDLARREEALDAYDRAAAIDPSRGSVWNNKACILSDLGRHEEALAIFDHALAIDPANPGTWKNKGRELKELGRLEEALAAYDCAIAVDPTHIPAWWQKADVLRGLGRASEALEAETQAWYLEQD